MKRVLAACVLAVSFAAVPACTATQGSPSFAPPADAAPGRVVVREAMNGNTQLVVDVNDLPPPRAVDASSSSYVVWLRPLGPDGIGLEDFLNIGSMRVDDEQRGRLSALTPHRAFELMVTAEKRANASEPSGAIVMRSHVER